MTADEYHAERLAIFRAETPEVLSVRVTNEASEKANNDKEFAEELGRIAKMLMRTAAFSFGTGFVLSATRSPRSEAT